MRETFKKNKKLNEPISILTPNGKITIVRNLDYCSNCGETIGQNDNLLGILHEHRITKDLLETVAYAAQMVPGFKNAEEVLFKLKGLNISATQIRHLSEDVGKDVFDLEIGKANSSFQVPEIAAPQRLEKDKIDTILYLTMDGSAVNTRIQDINGSTWKEMKLGLTFLDKDIIRRKDNACIITKKEYVTYLGSVEEFKKLLFNSAVISGYGSIKKVVIIADGAHWIWNICKELFPDAECILDFYHMKENVYNYAKELFNHNEKIYTKWAETVIHYVYTGQLKKAFKKISQTNIQPKKLAKTVNLEGYLNNNKDRMKYLEYRNKGYYIGSGMIESGNKVVVQKRMKQAGMRWSVNGAQYIAVLRAKYESNKWVDVEKLIYGLSCVA